MAAVTVRPPSQGKEDDPREMVWACVDDLVIDEDVQRTVDESRHRIFHNEWDWDLAEVPTVSQRRGGVLVVTEGQHRVLRRRETAPHSYMWVVKRSGEAGTAAEAGAAQGIAKGRRGHTALDQWDLRLLSGEPYVVAGDRVLTELGLVMGSNSPATGIMAASAVNTILAGGRRTPAEGEDLLRQTLLVLVRAWTDDQSPGARWEAPMLRAVAHLIDVNRDIISYKRLVDKLDATSSATAWLKRARERAAVDAGSQWMWIARLVGESYNNSMRREDRKLAW